MGFERVRCPSRGPNPQLVDQQVTRDDLVCVQRQQCEQRPLFRTTEPKRAAVVLDLDRPQQAEQQQTGILRVDARTRRVARNRRNGIGEKPGRDRHARPPPVGVA